MLTPQDFQHMMRLNPSQLDVQIRNTLTEMIRNALTEMKYLWQIFQGVESAYEAITRDAN